MTIHVNATLPKGRNKWVVRLNGTEVPTKSKQIRRGGFDTEEDALAAGYAERERILGNTFVARANTTLAEVLDDWIGRKKKKIKPTTAEAYELDVKRIKTHIGDIAVQKLTVTDVEDKLYDVLIETLSNKTVRNVGFVLRGALKDAERREVITRNVAMIAELPEPVEVSHTTWTSSQMKAFLASIEGVRHEAVWRLAMLTGMRRGELAALRWSRVDFAKRTVRVDTSRVKAYGNTVEGTPKSKKSIRTVEIDDKTLRLLKKLKRSQASERLAAGDGWAGGDSPDDDFLLAYEDGRPLAPGTITRQFSRLVMATDLPYVTLHEGARHSFATMMIQEVGESVNAVSERLGHSDVVVTMRNYVNTTSDDDRRVADKAASMLG